MPITIDTKTLNVSNLAEDTEVVAVATDAWESQVYKRKLRLFGIVKSWTIDCFEDGVLWVDSVAKYLQDKAKADTAVNFVISEAGVHDINVDCYVIGVIVKYSATTMSTNHREFTITLQEKT